MCAPTSRRRCPAKRRRRSSRSCRGAGVPRTSGRPTRSSSRCSAGPHDRVTTDQIWLTVGLLGPAFFSARFIVQWIASERRKRSVVPRAFWYFSVGGGITLLAYAIYRRDPVFIMGQGAGLFVYGRDL